PSSRDRRDRPSFPTRRSSDLGEGDPVRQLTELRRYADDDLKRRLESVPGVAAIRVGGGLEDEIQVDLDIQQLARIGLPIENVIQDRKSTRLNSSHVKISYAVF